MLPAGTRVAAALGRAAGVSRAETGAAAARCVHASAAASSQLASANASAKVGRFYREVTVAPSDCGSGYHVLLDKRKLKSPLKRELIIPSDALAYMVAQEWDSQTTHIEKQSMHLTALCNTAVDSDVTADRNQHASGLLKFLETDTVCFFEEIPEDLHEMQKEAWTPLVQWFADKHEVHLPTTVSLSNDVPAETLAAAKQRLLDHSDWGAVGYDFAIQTAKSFVIGTALIDGHVCPYEAEALAAVETRFQTKRFGEVEWIHPLERADTIVRLAAAHTFTTLCEEGAQ